MDDDLTERRYLIRRPKALQYFHDGQLKKAAEKERVAGRFELFFDLLCMFLLMTRKSCGNALLIDYRCCSGTSYSRI